MAPDGGWRRPSHCSRSCMRRPTSSCSQGGHGGAACCQRCAAMGSMVGGESRDMVRARLKRRAVYWPHAFKRRPVAICPPAPTMPGLPYLGRRRAAVRGVLGHVSPHRPIGPTALHRLRLGPAQGYSGPRCGACLRQPPPWQACHVWVDYAYPWADLLTRWKLHQQPALARPLPTGWALTRPLPPPWPRPMCWCPSPCRAAVRQRGLTGRPTHRVAPRQIPPHGLAAPARPPANAA